MSANPAPTKLETLFGGIDYTATLQDGSQETVRIRQAPVAEYQRAALFDGDEFALVDWYCNQAEGMVADPLPGILRPHRHGGREGECPFFRLLPSARGEGPEPAEGDGARTARADARDDAAAGYDFTDFVCDAAADAGLTLNEALGCSLARLELLSGARARARAIETVLHARVTSLAVASGFGSKEAASALRQLCEELADIAGMDA